MKTYQIHEKKSYLFIFFARKHIVLWKIYTAGKYFTRPTVMMVATNFKSAWILVVHDDNVDGDSGGDEGD